MSSLENKAGTNAFVLTFSKIMTLFMSIVTAMILARALSLDEYGTYSELLTISSLGVSLFSLGLPNALNYFLPQYSVKEDRQKFLGFYFTVVSAISLIIMAVLLFTNSLIADYYGNPRLVTYSYFLLIIPWTKLIISSRSNMLVAKGQVVREVVYCILNSVSLAAISVFLLLSDGTLGTYVFLYVIVESIFALIVYMEAFRVSEKSLKFNFKLNNLKELLNYTIPLGLSTAVSTISLDLDKLVIGWFMDESSVAIYANAGKELPFSLISTSFTAVFLPQIVMLVKNNSTKSALIRWKDIMKLNYIILVFCSGVSIVFAPQIITLLYSSEYLGGVEIFRIYSLTLLLRITYWAMILNAYGRTKEILYNSIVCLLVNILLSFVLFKYMGFIGPAVATVISIFAMALLQIFRTSRLLAVPIRSIIPIKGFILPTAVTFASGLIVRLVISNLNLGIDTRGILITVMIVLIWGLIYLAIFGKSILTLWKNMNKKAENLIKTEGDLNGSIQ